MTFTVKVSASKTTLRLTELPERLRSRLVGVVAALDGELVSLSRAKASGDLVQVHTGKYVASIKGETRNTQNWIAGIVSSDAPQADVLEWGGTIPFHEILPNVAKALSFIYGGGRVFYAGVAVPDVKIKKRGVLHSALYALHQKILTDMGQAVGDIARGPG